LGGGNQGPWEKKKKKTRPHVLVGKYQTSTKKKTGISNPHVGDETSAKIAKVKAMSRDLCEDLSCKRRFKKITTTQKTEYY